MKRDAKQEAEELVHLFDNHVRYWDCYNDEPLEENHSVLCAIIAQQRILELNIWNCNNEEELNYQREILKELEKL